MIPARLPTAAHTLAPQRSNRVRPAGLKSLWVLQHLRTLPDDQLVLFLGVRRATAAHMGSRQAPR